MKLDATCDDVRDDGRACGEVGPPQPEPGLQNDVELANNDCLTCCWLATRDSVRDCPGEGLGKNPELHTGGCCTDDGVQFGSEANRRPFAPDVETEGLK